MSDNNFVRKAMEEYLPCKNWLDEYQNELIGIDTQMEGKTTSSIIAMVKGIPDPNASSHRITKYSQKLDDFIKSNEREYNRCLNTIAFCDLLFDEIQIEYLEIFKLAFVDGLTFREIERQLPFSLSDISKKINEETKRLSSFY